MHGVVDRLDDVQDGGQSFLKFGFPVFFAALQHFLDKETQRHRKREREGECVNKNMQKKNKKINYEEVAIHECFLMNSVASM